MTGLEISVCVLAVLAGTMVKAVTGMGFPLIAIPVISLFVSVQDAVAIVAVPNLALNAVLCWRARGARRQTRDLPVLAITGMLGAVAGTWLLVRVDEQWLMLAVALAVLGYVVHGARHPLPSLSAATARTWSPAVGLVGGVMQGAVGIGGPPAAAWFHAYRLPAEAFVFSLTLLFLLWGGTQLTILAADGMLQGTRLWVALALVPPVLALVPIGNRLRDRLDRKRFERAVLVALTLSGCSLVARALG